MNQHEAAPARVHQNLAGTHILTLDDESHMRSLIRAVLSQFGCRDIYQARNGSAALELFEANSIDLVICDWMMEPMNGFQFLTELRKFAKGAQVPVIMLTGNSDPWDALKVEHLNIAAWLVKPITPNQLIERIGTVLSLPTQLFSIEDDLHVDLSGFASDFAIQYRAKLSNEMRELNELVSAFRQQPKHGVLHHWSSMVRLFHTIKGQAGTFGYDLITTLAATGQNLLRESAGDIDVLIKFQDQLQGALSVLVTAMSLVLQNEIKGDAGNVGQRLLTKINEVTVPVRKLIEAELKNAKKA